MRVLLCIRPTASLFTPKGTGLRPYRLASFRPQPWHLPRHIWSGHRVPTETTASNHSTHLPPASETSESKLFAAGSSLATRMSTDRKFQCTQFNNKGEIVVGHGHIQRSELVNKYGILPRDLRKIDESQLPAILVRQSTILVNFLHFRVLITHEDVLILHIFKPTTGETNHISAFMYELQGKLQLIRTHHGPTATLPYEFRALETILIMVMSELDIDLQKLQEPVQEVIHELDQDVSLEKLKKLADVSRHLNAFSQKVKLVREALRTILDADDDMAAMYLSEKNNGTPRKEENHEEVELLIENYYECGGEIGEKAEHLLSDVEVTHDSVKSILDSHRNSIMMLDIHFSVAMLSIATGTYVAGLYGMNVINGLEEAASGFPLVTGGSIVGMIVFGLFGLHRVRKIKKVLRLFNSDRGPTSRR